MTSTATAVDETMPALRVFSPMRLISWAIVIALTAALLYPMITSALIVFGPGHAAINLGQAAYELGPVLLDTLYVCIGSAIPAIVIGVLLAWAHERTNAQLGFIGELLPLSAMLVPQIAGVVGWIVLFDPSIGYANVVARWLLEPLGIELFAGPFDIYSPTMIVLLCSVYLVPYAFLLASTGFQMLDTSMEEAARTCGANGRRTFFTVTLPAIAPTIASIVILVLMKALMMFGIVAALGTRADMLTLPVYIYRLMSTYPANEALALLLSGAMVLLIQLLLMLESRFVKAGRSATIGGKGNAVRRVQLGKSTNVVRGMALVYLLVTTVLPALAVLLVSFMPFWSGNIQWDQLTFANYASMFEDPQVSSSIVNSLLLGAIGATVVVLLSVVICTAHKSAEEGKVANTLTSLPAMIPHTLIGVAFIIAYSRWPFSLYGTTFLLLLAYVVMELPFVVQTMRGTSQSISSELSEAAHVSGAGEFRTFMTVQLPLMMSGGIGAWIIAFMLIKSEVTASALLSGVGNPTLGPTLLSLAVTGTYNSLTALASFITCISTLLIVALLILRRRGANRMRIGG